MTTAELLPLAVVSPITGGVAAPLLARWHRRLPLVVGMVALAGALVVLIAAAIKVYAGDGHVLTHFLSNEKPEHGRVLGIAFAADPFGLAFALLAAAIGLILLLSALSELGDLGSKELGGLAALAQLLIAALIGAALTADTVNLFVWFEVAALSSYGLTGFFLERPIAMEAAFKNLVLTSMAGFAVFLGASMLYTSTGALNFGQLHRVVPVDPNRAQLVALALLVAGFATKAGVVPFHGWLPDTHTPVPGAVSALFSGLMVDLGVVAMARVALVLVPTLHRLQVLLTVLGIVSAVMGALLALGQDDLKRLLAWDTVSQMGLLVAGFASRTSSGIAGAVYHLVNHGLFKALMFLCAGAIVHSTGVTSIWDMGGLVRRRPLTTAAFTVACAAIAGLPPLNGYASLGLIHDGLRDQPFAFGFALLAQVLTVAALSRAAYVVFYRRRSAPYEHLEATKLGMRVSLITLAAGCVAFGVAASPFVRQIAAPAASVLLHPARYAAGALSSGTPLPPVDVHFEYLSASTLGLTAAEIVIGVALAALVVRRGVSGPISWVRRLHTGSVNDYAAFSAIGLAVSAVALLA